MPARACACDVAVRTYIYVLTPVFRGRFCYLMEVIIRAFLTSALVASPGNYDRLFHTWIALPRSTLANGNPRGIAIPAPLGSNGYRSLRLKRKDYEWFTTRRTDHHVRETVKGQRAKQSEVRKWPLNTYIARSEFKLFVFTDLYWNEC